MCTQLLIWCSCHHGEFLPINRCPQGLALGVCWTVVHGNGDIVVPQKCSYCMAGLNERAPLGGVRPVAGLAVRVEGKGMAEGKRRDSKVDGETNGDAGGKEWWDVVEDLGCEVGEGGKGAGLAGGDGGELWPYS
ncbi:unnamed protein product [Zymoseptoria tritici ST99CH_3D1]|uniref:Uncharacterized protein n=1 Tax=Zymoseptoria tritici ST99CH_1E4 TaxID=1276532 RepID=A0A2H1GYC8_ZYMTR|nr:unnamed protein product [Zymoseptoria tritici ST99CH_1E4]SMR61589.1 unnamed protein product [Zymoseptoria tritici ST99CH_3D1]